MKNEGYLRSQKAFSRKESSAGNDCSYLFGWVLVNKSHTGTSVTKGRNNRIQSVLSPSAGRRILYDKKLTKASISCDHTKNIS